MAVGDWTDGDIFLFAKQNCGGWRGARAPCALLRIILCVHLFSVAGDSSIAHGYVRAAASSSSPPSAAATNDAAMMVFVCVGVLFALSASRRRRLLPLLGLPACPPTLCPAVR